MVFAGLIVMVTKYLCMCEWKQQTVHGQLRQAGFHGMANHCKLLFIIIAS